MLVVLADTRWRVDGEWNGEALQKSKRQRTAKKRVHGQDKCIVRRRDREQKCGSVTALRCVRRIVLR